MILSAGMPRADACARCGYRLDGLPYATVCPECGRRTAAIEPNADGRLDPMCWAMIVAAPVMALIDHFALSATLVGSWNLSALVSPVCIGVVLIVAYPEAMGAWKRRVRLAVLLVTLGFAFWWTEAWPRTQGGFHHRWRMTDDQLSAYGRWWIVVSIIGSWRAGCLGLLAGPAIVRAGMRRALRKRDADASEDPTPR